MSTKQMVRLGRAVAAAGMFLLAVWIFHTPRPVEAQPPYLDAFRLAYPQAIGTKLDNWSTKGNVNPYTGMPGTKDPW